VSDDTEIGIDAITEDIKDPEKRRAIARIIRRNSMVAKILIWVTITILTGVLGAVGAHFGGLINVVD